MHYSFYLLLALLPPSALAGKEAGVTKTFKFKEDFFLKFHELPTAIGPDESGEDMLMSALEGFASTFKEVWINEIESNLQNGLCKVNGMKLPTFSMCDWKYPDRYDIDELPMPGQCYKHENGFVQRMYYKIKDLEITCPEDFSYDDLDKDAYTEEAFSSDDFLNIINPPNASCDGDISTCLFANAETVDWSTGYDACNAELYINRFTDVPVYLKCLDQGYGPSTANKIIKALDKYFEVVVSEALAEKIMSDAPEGFIYNLVSPYASDREFCAHGSYYTGGNLVNQVPDSDGVYITKFTYGFDVIWYKPKDFKGDILPDIETTITEAMSSFLTFLENEYPDYEDFIQDGNEVCDVIDPKDAVVTFSPTKEPSVSPTESTCDVDTNEGCLSFQVCRKSCVLGYSQPECYDDEFERDCGIVYGPGWICFDSNGDGIITANDNSDGCQFLDPTSSPTNNPTPSPVVPIVITSNPTISPSLRPTTLSPTVSYPPTKFIHPSSSPTETLSPTSKPSPTPSTSEPTLDPTVTSTSGDTTTVDTDKTLSPTPARIRPAETRSPTLSPTDPLPTISTPAPTCPNCIVHPDDTDEDECPIVTVGTCGDGERGDGVCSTAGDCCSKWGWCGATPMHCDDESVAPTPSTVEGAPSAPTYSVDAGQCASGDIGDGFCFDGNLCCSDWGYCGSGEQYCFTTRIYSETDGEEEDDGTCGAGGIGDGQCRDGLCCSKFGFCGDGDLYCTGQNYQSDAEAEEAEQTIKNSPIVPDFLKPDFGFRCGFTEVDARSNCKAECSHHTQCQDGEECWGIQLNYCNTFEEDEHPVCTNLDLADNDSRCGFDETSARGHCGPKCDSDTDCYDGEYCFPTLLNLCECHEQTCSEECEITFSKAKALISPYFVQSDPMDSENSVEGKPRNASLRLNLSLTALMVAISAHAFKLMF